LPQRIGEILIGRGKLDPANLERALKLQEGEAREKIGVILLRLGMVSGRDLADALADQLDLPLASAAIFPSCRSWKSGCRRSSCATRRRCRCARTTRSSPSPSPIPAIRS
jgi:hypothetical protein